jgi:hypothetical protein
MGRPADTKLWAVQIGRVFYILKKVKIEKDKKIKP